MNLKPRPGPANHWQSWPWLALGGFACALTWHGLDIPQQDLFLFLNSLANQSYAAFWGGLTLLGDTVVLLCLIAPTLRFKPNLVMTLMAAIPAGSIMSVGFKSALAAPRPGDVLDPALVQGIFGALSGNSFPSGHTLTAFCAVCVSWIVMGPFDRSLQARLLGVLVFVLGSIVALSRVMLGVHWPIDLIAGASLGWLAGLSGGWLMSSRPDWAHSRRLIWGLSALLALLSLHLAYRAFLTDDGSAVVLWLASFMPWVNLALQRRAHLSAKSNDTRPQDPRPST